MNKHIEEIEKILSLYSNSTNIKSSALNVKDMNLINCPNHNMESGFCEIVHSSGGREDDCLNSYLYGGRQAEKLGEAYIFFCPYGLVNWAVPPCKGGHFIIGGPTLIHPIDDFLLEDIFKQNHLLKGKTGEIKKELKKIPYVDPVRTRYLAELLMQLTRDIQDSVTLEGQNKLDKMDIHFNNVIKKLKEEEKVDSKSKHYPIEKENELIVKVKSGDKDAARNILNQLLGYIYFNNGNNFEIIKPKAIELMTVLARAAIETGADLEVVFGLEYMLYERLNEVEDINQLSECLSIILDRFIESTFTLKNVKNKDIIYKAVNYIRNNYYNKNISLKNVADEIGLSTSYFSKLFKEEMGLSYNEYLNRTRIAVGKELLKNNVSIAVVAQSVGYNDQSYFSKVFKKIEGVSPGNYN